MHNTLLSRPRDRLEDGGSLARMDITTACVPRSEQFEYWRGLVAPLIETQAGDASQGFLVEESAWNLGSIALLQNKTAPFQFQRTARHVRADSIDHWVIIFVREGALTLGRRGQANSVPQRVLRVASFRGEFEGRADALDALFLFVPREFCGDSTSILDSAEERELTNGLSLLLADYLLDLERRLPVLTQDELPSILATTRTLLLACLAPTTERLAQAQRPIDATLLERARRLIQEELLSPRLNVDLICRRLGVSRSRLYRLFEPAGGIAHYIRARRLLDAHISLANTQDQRRIADIAADRGFLDAAEFSRAFKREFGYTPSDVRREASQGPMRPAATHGTAGEEDLVGLLRGLHPLPQW